MLGFGSSLAFSLVSLVNFEDSSRGMTSVVSCIESACRYVSCGNVFVIEKMDLVILGFGSLWFGHSFP